MQLMSWKIIWLLAGLFLFVTGCRKPNANDGQPSVIDEPVSEIGLLTFSPMFPAVDAEVTLWFDATKGNAELKGYQGDCYAHIGVITSLSENATDWKHVKTAWGENTAATRFVRQSADRYELSFNPSEYFGVPVGEKILKIALVVRNADGSKVARNGDGSELYLPLFEAGKLAVRFSAPEMQPLFEPAPAAAEWFVGQEVNLRALSSSGANLDILVNGASVASANGTSLMASYTLVGPGSYTFTVKAAADGQTSESGFSLLVIGEPETAELPAWAAANGVTFA